jgi:hypothetical protein
MPRELMLLNLVHFTRNLAFGYFSKQITGSRKDANRARNSFFVPLYFVYLQQLFLAMNRLHSKFIIKDPCFSLRALRLCENNI